MNKMDLLKAIGEVDQELVEQASPKGNRKRTLRWIAAGSIAAACLILGILAISGGWFRREKTPEETSTLIEESTDYREAKKVAEPTQSPTPMPSSTESQITALTEPPTTEDQTLVILYQKDGIIVEEKKTLDDLKSERKDCLAYLTEAELFGAPLTMRAVLTDYKPIEITEETQEGTKILTVAALLTFKPLKVLHGTLPAETEAVTVFADYYYNTSLYDSCHALSGANMGREGIIMLYPMDKCCPDYMTALADYRPGDNMRFAIWEREIEGIDYAESAFPGLHKSWSLDQAEAYALCVIRDQSTAPADFAVSVRIQYWDEKGQKSLGYYYDSREELLSREGTPLWEELYGAEHMRISVPEDRVLLDQLYHACKRLKDLPEEIKDGVKAGSSDSREIRISFYLDGKWKEIHFEGLYYTPVNGSEHQRLLDQSETEIRYYLNACAAVRAWEREWMEAQDAGNP